MSGVAAVFKRELASYFATPIAYVFIVIFLVLAGVFTFFYGGFYETGQADLAASSIGTRGCICSSCRRSEHAALGRGAEIRQHRAAHDAAARDVASRRRQVPRGLGIHGDLDRADVPDLDHRQLPRRPRQRRHRRGLPRQHPDGGRVPRRRRVHLGGDEEPSHRVHLVRRRRASCCWPRASASCSNVLSGIAPQWLVDGLASLGFQAHFDYISKGVIDLRDLVYFALLIGAFLYANTIVLELKKAD